MAEIFTRFKGHDIVLQRDSDEKSWYIRVRGADGLYVYDGYWRDSAGKTAKEALYEAKVGAMLIPKSPSMDPFAVRGSAGNAGVPSTPDCARQECYGCSSPTICAQRYGRPDALGRVPSGVLAGRGETFPPKDAHE